MPPAPRGVIGPALRGVGLLAEDAGLGGGPCSCRISRGVARGAAAAAATAAPGTAGFLSVSLLAGTTGLRMGGGMAPPASEARPAAGAAAGAATRLRGVEAGSAGGALEEAGRPLAPAAPAAARAPRGAAPGALGAAALSCLGAGLLAAGAAWVAAGPRGVLAAEGPRLPASPLCMDMALAGRDGADVLRAVSGAGSLLAAAPLAAAVPSSSTSSIAVSPHLNCTLSRTLPRSSGSHSMLMTSLLLGASDHSNAEPVLLLAITMAKPSLEGIFESLNSCDKGVRASSSADRIRSLLRARPVGRRTLPA
jgi:hypothetical protein